jgi:hypothetical protein
VHRKSGPEEVKELGTTFGRAALKGKGKGKGEGIIT